MSVTTKSDFDTFKKWYGLKTKCIIGKKRQRYFKGPINDKGPKRERKIRVMGVKSEQL